jgi:hypothetical protein
MTDLARYRVELTVTSRHFIELFARDEVHAEQMAAAIYHQRGSAEDFEPVSDSTRFGAKQVQS